MPFTRLKQAEPEKLYGLDHLRALAISLVFFSHYPSDEFANKILAVKDFGWIGVDLFFVLSGFLIAKQLFHEVSIQNKISLKKFFIKRFFRIIPVYFVVVGIYFSIPNFKETTGLPPLWKFVTFTQNFGLNPSTDGAFSHAWSLCVEEQFYLLFPLIIMAAIYFKLNKYGGWLIAGFFIFTCLTRLYIWNYYMQPIIDKGAGHGNFWITWIYYPTYTRLDGLLAGIGIAGFVTFYPQLKDKVLKYGNALLLTGIAILALSFPLAHVRRSFNANIFGFPVIAIGFGFIVLAAISPSCVLYKIKSGITTSIALLSYSVYLIHKAVTHLCVVYFEKMGIDKDSGWILLLSIVFTLFGAVILRYTVEKPFLKLRDKLIVKKINPALIP